MSQLSVLAKITTKEGKRDELVAAFKEYLPQVEKEDGTLVYALSTDQADENAVWVYELYRDRDALTAHGGSDAMKAFGASLGALIAGAPELIMTTPEASKGLPG